MPYHYTLKHLHKWVDTKTLLGAGATVVGETKKEMMVMTPTDSLVALSKFGRVAPCWKMTFFGVAHCTRNTEIVSWCGVSIVGDHLCGKKANTKDITAVLSTRSNLQNMGTFCESWVAVHTDGSTPTKHRSRPVVMLQAVPPPYCRLTKDDQIEALGTFLRVANNKNVELQEPNTVTAAGHQSKKTGVFAFYIWCGAAANAITNLDDPLLDAVPLRMASGDVAYLNTVQLSEKPGVYDNKNAFKVTLPDITESMLDNSSNDGDDGWSHGRITSPPVQPVFSQHDTCFHQDEYVGW